MTSAGGGRRRPREGGSPRLGDPSSGPPEPRSSLDGGLASCSTRAGAVVRARWTRPGLPAGAGRGRGVCSAVQGAPTQAKSSCSRGRGAWGLVRVAELPEDLAHDDGVGELRDQAGVLTSLLACPWEGPQRGLTLPLSGRQGVCGGEAKGGRWPVHLEGLVRRSPKRRAIPRHRPRRVASETLLAFRPSVPARPQAPPRYGPLPHRERG